MSRTHALVQLAETQHGLLANRQAHAMGLSPSDVAQLRSSQHWVALATMLNRLDAEPK